MIKLEFSTNSSNRHGTGSGWLHLQISDVQTRDRRNMQSLRKFPTQMPARKMPALPVQSQEKSAHCPAVPAVCPLQSQFLLVLTKLHRSLHVPPEHQ